MSNRDKRQRAAGRLDRLVGLWRCKDFVPRCNDFACPHKGSHRHHTECRPSPCGYMSHGLTWCDPITRCRSCGRKLAEDGKCRDCQAVLLRDKANAPVHGRDDRSVP